MPSEVEGVQVFRYEAGELNYEPRESAPREWDGNLSDLLGDYIRVEDVDLIRSQERQRVREELFSELEAAGWSAGVEIPMDDVEEAFDRILERAALDNLEDEDA